MNKFEAYFLLLNDSIFGNLVLYPSGEFVLFAMQKLVGYNSHIILLTSILGFIIAVILNYFFGKILYKIYKASVESNIHRNHDQLVIYSQNYRYIILLFNIFPTFGSFIPLLAGFVSFGILRSMLFCLLSKILFYAYYLYL